MKPGRSGLKRLFYACVYTCAGLRSCFRHEAAFRQEIVLCLVMAPLGFWLGKTAIERALLIGTLLIVLVVELLNSAIEAVVDRFGEEHHALCGRAKDMGSAAVFLALVLVVLTWGLILFR